MIVEFFSVAISASVPRNLSWRVWGFLEIISAAWVSLSAAWNLPSAWMTLARRSSSASAFQFSPWTKTLPGGERSVYSVQERLKRTVTSL